VTLLASRTAGRHGGRRLVIVLGSLLAFGAVKLPAEHALDLQRQKLHFRRVNLNLGLREQIGQLGLIAALSGFRAIVADALFIEAHVAWEQTEWGRVLLLFRQVTTLQPRSILFWDMAAWHMGWNASVAALNDRTQPRLALRIKAQRQYFALAKDFLERGIKNNPNKPQLYESLARLYQQKYKNHERAAEYYAKAAALPGAPDYEKRFAAYELSYCPDREREAYRQLHRLYEMGEKERLPTLIRRLKFLEEKLNIPQAERIPDTEKLNR
jgi:tetratricopeptide (TPR) repeat protein